MTIDALKVCDDFGKLKEVLAYEFYFENEGHMRSAVQLIFEKGDIFHEAIRDSDEITCSSALISSYDRIIDISQTAPWNNVLGKDTYWLWTLTNQKGYLDAVQYSFIASNIENIVQLMVKGAEIETYEVTKKL